MTCVKWGLVSDKWGTHRHERACLFPAQAPASGLPQEVPFEGLELGPMLGKGVYGVVYRGLWRGQRVAVKVPPLGCPASAVRLRSSEQGIAAASTHVGCQHGLCRQVGG